MRFCPLYSGSSGNVSFAEGGGTRLLIDAGLPGKTVAAALESRGVDPRTINGILITHDHSDHVAGVGVFARRYKTPVYANAATARAMTGVTGAIPGALMRVFETGRDFYINSLNVYPFPIPHDAAEPVGFCLADGEAKLTAMTDIGVFNDDLFAAAAGSGLVLIEANHDVEMLKCGGYPYPLKRRILGPEGHLSNDGCAVALIRLYGTGVRRAVLAHLSLDNNYEALALATVREALRAADIPDGDFLISLAHRDAVGDMFVL